MTFFGLACSVLLCQFDIGNSSSINISISSNYFVYAKLILEIMFSYVESLQYFLFRKGVYSLVK